MSISPLKGAGVTGIDPRNTDVTSRTDATSTGSKSRAVADGADQLDLSAEAAALPSSDQVPSGEVSADRLREIGQRLANGEYNSAAGIDRLAAQLLASPDLLDGAAQ